MSAYSSTEGKRFTDRLERDRANVEARCAELLDERASGATRLREAMAYSLLGSGKRLRPLLCLWTHDALGGSQRPAALDAACALECLHTYTLIHDDLPCMDDDDLRRGKPSSHVEFGEGTAVLAGDALLTLCFEVLASLVERWSVNDGDVVALISAVAGAAGARGLITGQILDLSAVTLEPSVEMVDRIHLHKTAALIAVSMEAGAILAGASSTVRKSVYRGGLLAGHAFQIVDDVLDLQADAGQLGKTPGKDVKERKLTYPAVAGVEASRERARTLVQGAKQELAGASDVALLAHLLDTIVDRTR
jgi:geranylgeranyl diphosphate synthase type II